MNLQNISSKELIKELDSRDLYESINDKEKIKWLKNIGVKQQKIFSFIRYENNMIYSLEYLNKNSLEKLKANHNRDKKWEISNSKFLKNDEKEE